MEILKLKVAMVKKHNNLSAFLISPFANHQQYFIRSIAGILGNNNSKNPLIKVLQ